MKYKLKQLQYSRIYRVSERTIRTWQRKGWPLDRPAGVFTCMGGQKNTPASLQNCSWADIEDDYDREATIGEQRNRMIRSELRVWFNEICTAQADIVDILREEEERGTPLPDTDKLRAFAARICAVLDELHDSILPLDVDDSAAEEDATEDDNNPPSRPVLPAPPPKPTRPEWAQRAIDASKEMSRQGRAVGAVAAADHWDKEVADLERDYPVDDLSTTAPR